MFDTLIHNARMVDGCGNPWYRGSLAIQDGRIAAVGHIPAAAQARKTMDARDMVVCPGFIDAHVHSDLALLADPEFPGGLYQGVTTHIIGQDGVSYAPAAPQTQAFYRHYFAAVNQNPPNLGQWRSVAEFLAQFDGRTSANVAYLVPHGTVRIEVMGLDERAPTPAEIRQMQALVAQGMADGAVGLSTGLEYLPCAYAETAELIALCRPVAAAGGIYVTHMRSYRPESVASAVAETLTIGREAALPVHISHFNGLADMLLPMIEDGRAAGIDITYDTYPYLAGSTILAMVALPRWVQTGGIDATVERLRQHETRARLREWFEAPQRDWAQIRLSAVNLPEHKAYEGLSVRAAAQLAGQSVGDFVCDVLAKEQMVVGCIAFTTWRSDDDVRRIMQHPAHMAGSDGIYVGGKPHPRGYGTFARYLGEYVREQKALRLEEMVRHMTSAPAQRFGLSDRGRLLAGLAADLVVFDPQTIAPRSTYDDGKQPAVGVAHVFLNGEAVLMDGQPTRARPGRGLKRIG
jgi:N-acyl-D-amino-acid deacylase